MKPQEQHLAMGEKGLGSNCLIKMLQEYTQEWTCIDGKREVTVDSAEILASLFSSLTSQLHLSLTH